MSTCSTCNRGHEPGALFCLECGNPLDIDCPRCGSTCPHAAKFCPACGCSLVEPSGRPDNVFSTHSAILGERKLVTILFADIVASTNLIEHLDADEAATRLQYVVELMRQAVRRFGGTVNKIQGDGVMALFGAPTPLEDHASSACFAAQAMQAFDRKFPDDAMQLRVGIHTGEVHLRAIENDLSQQYDAMGIAVHVAARLQQAAEPNTTFISKATLDAARETISTRERGPTELRGLSEHIRIFELIDAHLPSIAIGRSAIQSNRFVGRNSELLRLERAFKGDLAAQSRLVEIVGDPGSGKSRLLAEFLRRSRRRRALVFEGRAHPYGSMTPLQLAFGLMRSLFAIHASDDRPTIVEKINESLSKWDLFQHAPLLANFLGALDLQATSLPPDVSLRRTQILEAIQQITTTVATRTPCIFVVEDIHWTDEASKPFLFAIARALTGTPSLLVASRRLDSEPLLARAMKVEELLLSPLSRESLDVVIDDTLKGRPIATDVREQIAQRSAGNPFFAEELVRALDEQGTFGIEPKKDTAPRQRKTLGLPNTVRGVITYRIDRLSDVQKLVLQAASVLERSFSSAIVAHVAGIADVTVHEAIKGLLLSAFLSGGQAGISSEFSFNHPLVQEVAYASLVTERRQSMHRRAATQLVVQLSATIDEYSALIAHHWLEAGDHMQAVTYFMRSAQWIGPRDPSQAIESWHQVRKVLGLIPPDQTTTYMAMMACGQLINLAWRQAVSAETVEPIFTEAMTHANTLRDARAAALITMAYGRLLLATGSADKYVSKVKEAQELLSVSPNASAEALLTAVLSHAVGIGGNLTEAAELNRRALELEPQIEPAERQLIGFNPKFWLWTLRARLLVSSDKAEEAQVYLDLLLENQTETVDTLHQAIARGIQIDRAALMSNPELAEQAAQQLDILLRDNRTPYLIALGTHYQAVALMVMRRTQDARRLIENVLAFVRSARAGLEFEPYILANLGEVMALDSAAEAYARIDEGRWLARARSMRVAEAYTIASRQRVRRKLGLPGSLDDMNEFDELLKRTGAIGLRRRLDGPV
jgi:class 3 adenylate cyclase/tetratricopeptide (TPR) repeat protein